MNFSFIRYGASRGGYAALITVLVALGASVTIIGSFTFFALHEVKSNRAYTKAIEARTAAESGIEDVAYRIVSGKQVSASETLMVGNATTETVINQNGNQRTIRAEGLRDDYHQKMETLLDVTSDSASFYYGVQAGAGGITMDNGAQINGNVFSNGSITGGRITGSATVASGLATAPSVEWPVGCAASCGNADNAFATTSANRDSAQSFTANAAGALNKVSVFLGKVGNPSADITMRITADAGGRPDTAALSNGSAVIPRSSVGAAPSWIDVIFLTPPAVVSGTKYWIVLDYGAHSAVNHWNWRKDSTDGYVGHTGKSTTNWASGGAVWTDVGGDLAFRLWIGGVNTQMEDTTVDGTARAPAFDNVSAGGSVCPNVSCIVASDAPQPMPIPDDLIQDWKDAAFAAGGICGIADGCDSSGNYKLTNNQTGTLGPKKITGKLEIDNGATLTVKGTLWVVDDFILANPSSAVRLHPDYGALSGIIITDSKFNTAKGSLEGSGNPASYLMVVAAKNSISEEIITADNNSTGVIYYAPKGRIKFSNNATTKEATAYGITLDNNAIITYESGLADTHFSSGPSGGYDIKYWKQTE